MADWLLQRHFCRIYYSVRFQYTRFCITFGVLQVVCGSPSCLRRGPRGYCRSEWRTGGENRFLALSVSAEHESGQVICTHFQVFAMTRVKIEPSLPALVARAQPTVPPTRSIVPLRRAFIIL